MRLKGDICEENVIYLNKMRRKWQRIAVMCRNWQYIAVLKKLLDSEYKMKGWTTSALGRCGSRLEKWWETLEQFSQIVTNSLTELADINPLSVGQPRRSPFSSPSIIGVVMIR